jgi:hypothetical protein
MESYIENPPAAIETPEPAPRRLPRTKRGWQLKILEEMDLPKKERSRDGRPVKAVQMAAVLRAIDNRAGQDGWYFRDRAELMKEAQLDSLRQLDRCLEVLRERGLVESHHRTRASGARLCHFRIVFQDLCRLTTLPLWPEGDNSGDKKGTKQGHTQLPRWPRPVAQTGEPVAQMAEPVAHAGNTRTAPLSAPKKPRHETETGDRSLWTEEERGHIKTLANSINERAPSPTKEDRHFVLSVAGLVFAARLPENVLRVALESIDRHDGPIHNPLGFFRKVLRSQAAGYGIDLEDELKSAEYPRDLLPPPSQRAAGVS